jgi:hypothetical protein
MNPFIIVGTAGLVVVAFSRATIAWMALMGYIEARTPSGRRDRAGRLCSSAHQCINQYQHHSNSAEMVYSRDNLSHITRSTLGLQQT